MGWDRIEDPRFMVGLGAITVKSINNYIHLLKSDVTVKYVQYGNKTGRFIINGIEEDLIDIPEYEYNSTDAFYYNGHYSTFGTHNGTIYNYSLIQL